MAAIPDYGEYERTEALCMLLGAVASIDHKGNLYLVKTTKGEAGGLPVYHEEFFDKWGRPHKTKTEAIIGALSNPEDFNGT